MFLTCCFYVVFALVCLYLFDKFNHPKQGRRGSKGEQHIPKELEKSKEIEICTTNTSTNKLETLESFILKGIENSVKELEKKRVPFKNIDQNVILLDQNIESYVPKFGLNPYAEDYCPF
jgi:hypothetical protein